jgi:hypothetical protein
MMRIVTLVKSNRSNEWQRPFQQSNFTLKL